MYYISIALFIRISKHQTNKQYTIMRSLAIVRSTNRGRLWVYPPKMERYSSWLDQKVVREMVEEDSIDDRVEGYSGNQPESCSYWTSPSQCIAPTWVMPQQLWMPERSPHKVQSSRTVVLITSPLPGLPLCAIVFNMIFEWLPHLCTLHTEMM